MRRPVSLVLLALDAPAVAAPVPPPKQRLSLVGTWRAVWGTGLLNRVVTFSADGTYKATDFDTDYYLPEGAAGTASGRGGWRATPCTSSSPACTSTASAPCP